MAVNILAPAFLMKRCSIVGPPLICLVISSASQAAESGGTTGVSMGELATLGLGLGFVLLVIIGSAWAIKRMGVVPGAKKGVIRILAVTPVGSRERIALVEVGGQQLLLGITANQISLLHSFSEPVSETEQNQINSEFAQKLHQFVKRS